MKHGAGALAPVLAPVLALSLALGGISGASRSAHAQSDCILDNCADKRPPVGSTPSRFDRDNGDRSGHDRSGNDRFGGGRFGRPGPRGESRPGAFDFWVLSLSWSPGFCETGGAGKAREQCRPGAGLGFTVHGLWPQYVHGFPSDCRGNTNPPGAALDLTAGVYPDRGLARYEWRRHGTCSGMSPFAYFKAVRAARDAVTIPSALRAPHDDQHEAPAAIERAFSDANPGLRPGMVAAICRDRTLQEVRVCFRRDLGGFQACPEVVRADCKAGSLDVPAVR